MSTEVSTKGDEGQEAEGEGLAHEEAMLKHKLELLDEFMKKSLPSAVPTTAERCRILKQKIEAIEATISRAGKLDLARGFLQSSPQPTPAVQSGEFFAWLASQENLEPYSSSSAPTTKRPREETHVAKSRERVPYPELQPGSPYREILQSDDCMQWVGPELKKRRRPSKENIAQRQAEAIARGEMISVFPKRRIAVQELPPCLRCKILKRKCDSLERCSHCPQQSDENESDYWKVIGCFRGSLEDLSKIIIPAYSKLTTRTFQRRGVTQTMQLSPGMPVINLGNILHLLDNPAFLRLEDVAWENLQTRNSLSQTTSEYSGIGVINNMSKSNLEKNLSYFAAPQGLLKVGNQEPEYLKKTGYNLFALFRLCQQLSSTNEFDKLETISKTLGQAHHLVFISAELYISEKHVQQMATLQTALTVTCNPETATVVDVEAAVTEFLKAFESICSGRGKLTGPNQLACLYSLLLFGIAKSLLIDAYSMRNAYGQEPMWRHSDAVRINSCYKALVSIYSWASKADLLLDASKEEEESSTFNRKRDETLKMLRSEEWAPWGFKGSKDFLLSLGSSILPDRTFNGFFIQRYGLEKLTRIDPNTSNSAVEVSSHSLGFVAFAPSPGPPSNSSTISTNPPRGSSDQIVTFEWEKLVISPNDKKSADERVYSKVQPKPRARSGKLDPEVAVKIALIRKLKACWPCWVLKVPCSTGDVCQRCKKNELPGQPSLCSRDGFKDFERFFFPESLKSKFNKKYIENFINTHVSAWSDQQFKIQTNFGGSRSMCFTVFAAVPKTMDGRIKKTESIPVSLIDYNSAEVAENFRDYLRKLLADQFRLIANPSADGNTTFSEKLLVIIMKYYEADESKLLQNSLLLFMIHKFMRQPIIIIEPSASNVCKALNIKTPLQSSRLLDLQLKSVVNKAERELTVSVLEGLEKSLRARTRDSWLPSFCSILVLSMCIEELQVTAINTLSLDILATEGEVTPASTQIEHICASLEEHPYTLMKRLFHDIYKTHKDANNTQREKGWNALKQPLENSSFLLTPASDIVKSVHEMITENWVEINELANRPLILKDLGENGAAQNKGRLVARFLRSFWDEDALPITPRGKAPSWEANRMDLSK